MLVLLLPVYPGSAASAIDINTSIDRALTYLYNKSVDDVGEPGEIVFYSSTNRDMSNPQYQRTIFGSALVYHILTFNDPSDSRVVEMKKNIIDFILRHEEVDLYDDPNVIGNDTGGRIWRYRYDNIPVYPSGKVKPFAVPDIDISAMALVALHEAGYDVRSSTHYFAQYQMRDSFIKHQSTPYMDIQLKYNTFNTWIHVQDEYPEKELEYYDSVVNSNVLFFYGTQKEINQTDESVDYINESINLLYENRQTAIYPYIPWTGKDIKNFSSISYPSPLTFTYFASRAYQDGNVPDNLLNLAGIKDYMFADDNKDGRPDRQEQDGSWGNFEIKDGKKVLVTNDVETAQATLTLLNIYSSNALSSDEKQYAKKLINESISYLIENQNSDGSWDIAFEFWGMPPTFFAGSQELITGMVLEALEKSDPVINLRTPPPPVPELPTIALIVFGLSGLLLISIRK